MFYGTLASSRGDFATALRHGLVMIACFAAAALALGLADALSRTSDGRRADRPARADVRQPAAR